MIFLKLGGSLITDKTRVETAKPEVIARLGREIAQALAENPELRLVMGNGSGSFGHVAAAKHGTRAGVTTAQQWLGFAEVSDAAIRINALVRGVLRGTGVPVVSITASGSALCQDGQIIAMATEPIRRLCQNGLVPLLHGDVAFDNVRGGTIISTEEILTFVSRELKPSWILLAGETEGVYDLQGQLIPLISPQNLEAIRPALGGSRGTDVTGGMLSKVEGMLELAQKTGARIRIFDGRVPGLLSEILRATGNYATGTVIASMEGRHCSD